MYASVSYRDALALILCYIYIFNCHECVFQHRIHIVFFLFIYLFNNNNNRRLVTLAEHTSDHGIYLFGGMQLLCALQVLVLYIYI